MTVVGTIFLPLALLCSFMRAERLLSLLILASVFEASSVFNSAIGTFLLGVPPFYVVEVLIAIRLASLVIKEGFLLPKPANPRRKYVTALLVFWVFASATAFVLPHVFSGMPVYEPRGGIDEQYEALTPLRWSFSNLAQVLYLTLNVAAVLYAVRTIRTRHQVKILLTALGVSIGLVVAIGIVQRISIFQGWSFPYEVLNNNPGYSQGFDQISEGYQRINSTFTEPSFAGSFIAAAAIGLVASFLRGKRTILWIFAALATFLVLLDTTATNGYIAFGVLLGCLFLYFSPLRGPHHVRSFLTKGWLTLVLPLVCVGALLAVAYPTLIEAAFTLTSEKSDTLSFLHRVYSDLTALSIFEETWGLGVGLGSNRPSSLLMTFLSTIGIVGTVLFGIFLFRIVNAFPGKSAPSYMHWTFWSLMGLLLAQMVAVPDINRPVLWMLIVLVVVQLDIPFRQSLPVRVPLVVQKRKPAGMLPFAPAEGTEIVG